MDDFPEEKNIGKELDDVNKALNEVIGSLSLSQKDILDSVVKFGFVFDVAKDKLTRYILDEIEIHKGE